MEVTVLLFASYAEAFDADRLTLELPAGACVADLVAHLRGDRRGARLPSRPLVAVNRRYSGYEQVIGPTDEIAVVPPVAGG
jgi:molybdopterin converting factor small subunit